MGPQGILHGGKGQAGMRVVPEAGGRDRADDRRADQPPIDVARARAWPEPPDGAERSEADARTAPRSCEQGTSAVKPVRPDAKQVAAMTEGRRSLCGTRGWVG